MTASLISPSRYRHNSYASRIPTRQSGASRSYKKSFPYQRDDSFHADHVEVRKNRQANHPFRCRSSNRKVVTMRRRQPAVHRKIRDKRVKVTSRKDVVVTEFLIQGIPADWILRIEQYRKVGIVGH